MPNDPRPRRRSRRLSAYDVIRTEKVLARVRAYIAHNPARWVDDPGNISRAAPPIEGRVETRPYKLTYSSRKRASEVLQQVYAVDHERGLVDRQRDQRIGIGVDLNRSRVGAEQHWVPGDQVFRGLDPMPGLPLP